MENSSNLADTVRSAVLHNPHVDPVDIHFEADAGRVVIRGKVRSYFAKQMAQEAARKVTGVTQIENELNVV